MAQVPPLFKALETLTQQSLTLTQEIQALAENARGGGDGGTTLTGTRT